MLKAGVISYNDHHFTIPCTVRDKSDLGARLKIDDRSIAPDTFTLFIELDATEVDCEVVWRSNDEVGVRFTSEIKLRQKLRIQVVSKPEASRTGTIWRKPVSID